MTLQGKGIYIWKLHRVCNGHVQTMVNNAQEAKLTHVIIKIADGASAYNVDLAGPATDAFKAAGIQVWGWAWLWMTAPFQEAEIAAHRIKTLNMDGFIINAEQPAKNKSAEANIYMETLRERLADFPVPLGFSSYRYPNLHTSLPWQEFLTPSDLNLPQMYWVGETPADCVQHSVAKHQAFTFARPIIPTGAAFGEQYGSSFFRAEPAEIVEFMDTVRAKDLPAANFWSWDWTDAHGPDLWNAIANYDWPLAEAQSLDVAEQYWNALLNKDLDALAALYHDNAVFITAGHAAQGPAEIRAQAKAFLDSLPNAEFTKIELRPEDNVRFLHWSATTENGHIAGGLDTIGVRAGKIQYHSSSYLLMSN